MVAFFREYNNWIQVQFVNGRAKVLDLRRQQVHSAQHMNELIAESGAYRATAPTVFNERSSRSHAIAVIEVGLCTEKAH